MKKIGKTTEPNSSKIKLNSLKKYDIVFLKNHNSKTNEIKDNQKVDTDICVVGSGFAGIGCSQEFLGTDTSVVIVESGLLAPDKDVDLLNHGVSTGISLARGLSGSRNRQFGGTSASWSGGAGYLEPIDFRKRLWIKNSGWPIDKSDLESHYEKAYELLELGCQSNVRRKIDKNFRDRDPHFLSNKF